MTVLLHHLQPCWGWWLEALRLIASRWGCYEVLISQKEGISLRKPWHLYGLALCLDEYFHILTPTIVSSHRLPVCISLLLRCVWLWRPRNKEFPDKVAGWYGNRTPVAGVEIRRITTRPPMSPHPDLSSHSAWSMWTASTSGSWAR